MTCRQPSSFWRSFLWLLVALGVSLATVGLFVAAGDLSERGEWLDGLYLFFGMVAVATGLGIAALAWSSLKWPDRTRVILGRGTRWGLVPLAGLWIVARLVEALAS